MRPSLFLLSVSLLVAPAGAQIPAPKAKPVPAPKVAPAPLSPKAAPFPFKWETEELGQHFAFDWPGPAFNLNHDFKFDFSHEFELLKHDWELQTPKFEFDFSNKFDFKDLKLDFPKDLKFEFPEGWAQGPAYAPLPAQPAMPALPPMGHMSEMLWTPHASMTGTFERMHAEQGSPEDSLYRTAREALNRGEYARASTLFQSIESRYPRSRVAPAALYYRAFALYRAGSTDDLKAGVTALKAQQERYPEAASDPDAAALRTRIYAALAARGDAEASAQLRAATSSGATCDREDVEVRAEALNALAQLNPPEARPTLKKVLARRDECSVRLRRSAVYILGRSGTEEAFADLLEVAKNDPDPTVKSDAINMLGRASGTATVRTLETIFNESTDDRTRQAALSALKTKGGPEATRVLRAIIERNDVPERMRAEAVSQLASGSNEWRMMVKVEGQNAAGRPTPVPDTEDGAYLRSLYAKTESPVVKSAIISAVGRMGGTANDQFILGIARNKDESMRTRREALSRLRTSTLSIDDLNKLFESLTERDLRSAVVNQLASREEPAAVDKLIEIIKSGTDPQIRREAISALARRKDDPRATRLLLELVEKQP